MNSVNLTVVPPVPAYTNRPNVFEQAQTFLGNYNKMRGWYWDFERLNGATPSGFRFFREDDPVKDKDGHAHSFSLEMDFGNDGSFFCFYDNVLDIDILKVGVDGPCAGRFQFGTDGLVEDTQVTLHDIDSRINWSLALWSWHNGIKVNTRSKNSDCYTIQRDGTIMRHWLHWHQGDTTHDWRLGMGYGSYDLELWSAAGKRSSAELPGKRWLRLRNDPDVIELDVPLVAKEITDLQNQVDALKSRILALEKALHENHLL